MAAWCETSRSLGNNVIDPRLSDSLLWQINDNMSSWTWNSVRPNSEHSLAESDGCIVYLCVLSKQTTSEQASKQANERASERASKQARTPVLCEGVERRIKIVCAVLRKPSPPQAHMLLHGTEALVPRRAMWHEALGFPHATHPVQSVILVSFFSFEGCADIHVQ